MKLRVLAIASRFYFDHLDHLVVLAKHCDLTIAYNNERQPGTVAEAESLGLETACIGSIGLPRIEARLRKLVESHRPDILYTLWDTNEELTLMARRVAGSHAKVVHKCSDPLTTLVGMETRLPGTQPRVLEREAMLASDGQVFCTKAIRQYLESTHDLELPNSIIVPHARSEATVCPPSPKLSAEDGRTHIALVGFAHPDRGHGRCYLDIIPQLVRDGLVVHSHFHEVDGFSNQVYRDLASTMADYHYHPTVPNREGTRLSQTISRYDLMGVFHDLDAKNLNEAAVLEVCMPSKAICGWINGGIPVVCPDQYRGVTEFIDELGIGFAVRRLEDVRAIADDREAIARATEACLAERHRFTHEWNARRIVEFFDGLVGS